MGKKMRNVKKYMKVRDVLSEATHIRFLARGKPHATQILPI